MNDDLPEGWRSTTLGVVAEVNPRHPRDMDDDLMVTFVPMPVVSESDWNLAANQERPFCEVKTGYTHFAEGDVLFAKITPCMENGKAAVATKLRNGLGCGTTELHVLRPHEGIDAKYLYHFIHRESFRREAASNFTGSAGQLRVPVEFIRSAEFALAPTPEQRRIVAQVEALLAKVRSSRERLDNIRTILKRFRQAVLAAGSGGLLTADWRADRTDSATGQGLIDHIGSSRTARGYSACSSLVHSDFELPEVPQTWSWVRLAFLLSREESFCYGVVQPGTNDEHGVPLIRAGDLKNGRVNVSTLRRIDEHVNHEYRRSQLKGGELLVTVVGAGIGEIAIAQAECAGFNIARAVAKLPIREVNAEYVFLWLSSSTAIQLMKQSSREVARPTLNIEQLAEIPVPLPPLEEQTEIVRRINQLLGIADRLEARHETANSQVEKLTQSILAKAFRGELVPTEAALAKAEGHSYETAEELLARIKATSVGPKSKATRKRAIGRLKDGQGRRRIHEA